MKNIYDIVDNRCKQGDMQSEALGLLNTNYDIRFNNMRLYEELMSYIGSHCYSLSHEQDKVSFSLICDDSLYEEIKEDVLGGNRAEIVVLSYCSKEKGTIRALKFERENCNVFLGQKTPAIFIECNCEKKYYYIINTDYLNKIKFKLDGFKYFEHILNKLLGEQGRVLIHGAAVDYDGAIVIVGPKRAGKTTLFLEMIRVLGCKPIAFDKCHLDMNEGVDVYGMPTRLRVLAGTLSKYKDEMEYLIPEKYKNASQDELWRGESDSKIDMTFDDFERFCHGDKFVKMNKLRCIVIPSIGKSNPDEIRKSSFEEFEEIVNSQIFSPNNPEEDWWSECAKSIDSLNYMKERRDELVKYLWKNVPIIRVSASTNTESVLLQLKQMYL